MNIQVYFTPIFDKKFKRYKKNCRWIKGRWIIIVDKVNLPNPYLQKSRPFRDRLFDLEV